MRKKAAFKPRECLNCGKSYTPTAAISKYCNDCRIIKDKERKHKWYIENNPDAFSSPPPKRETETCEICDDVFYSTYKGINCCKKHYNLAYRTGDPYSPEGKPNTNTFYEKDGYMVGVTKIGVEYFFDRTDYGIVSKHSWCSSKNGGYLVANYNHKMIRLHRYVLNINNPRFVVDHINGNPLDNRKINLRVSTAKNNSRNSTVSKSNKIKHLGISTTSSGKYRARIMVNHKEINLGHFDKLEDAIKARQEAEKKYFVEYAPSLR